MKQEFYSVYEQWFPSEVCSDHRLDFIKTFQNCQKCQVRKIYDKRTTGLFKLELQLSTHTHNTEIHYHILIVIPIEMIKL